MTAPEIMSVVRSLSGEKPLMVSLSGGNPAIHNLKPLIELGKAEGFGFALETQGSIPQDWFADIDVLTLSPKPPSSGMKTDQNKLDQCIKAAGTSTKTVLKFVVFDENDYAYARSTAALYKHLPVYLQPGNHTPPLMEESEARAPDTDGIMRRMRWLVDKVAADRWFSASVLPQLHVLLWGNLRGV